MGDRGTPRLSAVDKNLAASWDRTRVHLSRAWVELPSGERDGLAQYHDYLDHNELGLAMEELERVGRLRSAPSTFWAALADAAAEMGLDESAQRFRLLVSRSSI